MSRYRKPGKQEAYEDILAFVGTWEDKRLGKRVPALSHCDVGARIFHDYGIAGNDFDEIVNKAIRVERGRRQGKSQMTKLSIDLSSADLEKLDRIRAKFGHSTKVAAIRALIRNEYLKA